jgi:hypothetical protein
MWLLHPENKSLHQLASIATNDLCQFHHTTFGCAKRKAEDVIKPAHLKKKTSPTKEKNTQ